MDGTIIENCLEKLANNYSYLPEDVIYGDIQDMLDAFREKLENYNSFDLSLERGDDQEWENFYNELKEMKLNSLENIVTYFSWEQDVDIEPYMSTTNAAKEVIDDYAHKMVESQMAEFLSDYEENIKSNNDEEWEEELDESKISFENVMKDIIKSI